MVDAQGSCPQYTDDEGNEEEAVTEDECIEIAHEPDQEVSSSSKGLAGKEATHDEHQLHEENKESKAKGTFKDRRAQWLYV